MLARTNFGANMKLSYTPIALAAVLLLSACTSQRILDEARGGVAIAKDRTSLGRDAIGQKIEGQGENTLGSAAYAERLANEQANMPVFRRAKSAYVGSIMVPVTTEDKLPAIFKKDFDLNFDDKKAQRRISLDVVAQRLTDLTKVPVRINSDVDVYTQSAMATPAVGGGVAMSATAGPKGASMSANALPPIPTAVAPLGSPMGSLPEVNPLDMKWRGTLAGFLNHLTNRLNLAWEYRDGTVVIMKFVTEFHEIAAFNGGTKYSMGTGGTASGQGGTSGTSATATSTLDVQDQGGSDPVASIEVSVKNMIAGVPGSTVNRAEGSGRLVVKTSKDMQAQVRDFIKAENASMLRQAQIQFDIYSVRTTDADERGFNWDVILTTLSQMYSFRVASPQTLTGLTSGTVGMNILTPDAGSTSDTARRYGGSSAIINLLNQVGENVQHRPVSLLAMNRTWARKSKLATEGYLAETTPGPASSVGVGAPGLKTDKVTTGDQYVALPQILDNNTVLLKFGLSLSDLLGIFDVTSGIGLTQQKVQVPNVQSINDQSIVALKPGQVAVITGLSRNITSSDQRTLAEGASVGLGGSRKIGMQREHFIIFVRPVVL
jgi:type IVB pilus formation R64 PilN family outer membrane protein